MPTVRKIVREAAQNNYRFSSIVMGIVTCQPFEMRVKIPQSLDVGATARQ
jgi:hypothetical protein